MKINKPKIAIFGAGIAGLSCAYFLKNDGYDVTVYEKRPDVGGRFATFDTEGVYINKGALMYAPRLNPHFASLINELGIESEQLTLSRFALIIGNKITALNNFAMFKSGLFTLFDYLKWLRLKRFIRRLDFRLDNYDERLEELHQYSLQEFCEREMGFNQKLIDYIVQPFSSFGYIDPPYIAADHGLFLFAYGDTELRVPIKGMSSVTDELHNKLNGSVKLNTSVKEVKQNRKGGFSVVLEEKGKAAPVKKNYDYCIFATGQASLNKIVPGIDFQIPITKTRGLIFEAKCPQFNPYDVLLFSKYNNSHGVHGGEVKRLPDGRSICGIFLYHPKGDVEQVFGKIKILPKVGWSPAITLIPPKSSLRDVLTLIPNLYVVGDFYRLPCIESCVYTAKKVAGIIADTNEISNVMHPSS